MNRRGFFGAIAAAVTAACVPASHATGLVDLRRAAYARMVATKGPGFITDRYSSQYAWWRPKYGGKLTEYSIQSTDFAKLEARTLAALQTAWKDCLAHKSGDTLMLDEQAYKIFNTLQE